MTYQGCHCLHPMTAEIGSSRTWFQEEAGTGNGWMDGWIDRWILQKNNSKRVFGLASASFTLRLCTVQKKMHAKVGRCSTLWGDVSCAQLPRGTCWWSRPDGLFHTLGGSAGQSAWPCPTQKRQAPRPSCQRWLEPQCRTCCLLTCCRHQASIRHRYSSGNFRKRFDLPDDYSTYSVNSTQMRH